MKPYFKLFRRFVLRAMAREKLRSAITALGIGLGVGVMIAIRLANASSLDSFRAAAESVAGETSLTITGAAGRFDELLLRDLDWLREYGQLSPVVDGYAMTLGSGDGPGRFLHILGVDIMRDRPLRRYKLLRAGPDEGELSSRAFLLLLADPHAIILTEKYARSHGLSVGGRLKLAIGAGTEEFNVSGLLADEGPARALDGRVALMDIAAAQWALDRIGFLDRVDVKLKPGLAVEEARAATQSMLPAGLTVASPEAGYGQVEKMIAAFHFNLSALGSIALLVGLFLIYNTVSISVIARREEVGMLRAAGASRKMVLALFLGEALLLACVGTAAGLGLGRLMASAAVRATATTVETFYISAAATESVARHTLGLAEVVIALAVALPLSLVAALVPALEASRVQPVEAIRGSERLARSFRPSGKLAVLAAMLLALGYGLSRLDAVGGLPVFGYAAAVALMFGGAFLVPGALGLACRMGRRATSRVEARLACSGLGGAIPRVSISVAALAVSLAMMVAISIMIESFRETVSYWVDQTLRADIFAKAVTRTTALAEGEIPAEAIAIIKADPEVEAVDSFTSQQVSYQGRLITLGAGDFDVLLKHGRLLLKSPSGARDEMQGAIGRDAIVASESFALRFKKKPGDFVDLPTPAGPRPFQLVAVYYDYTNNRGTVVMDSRTYGRVFSTARRPGSLSIFLRAGADANAAADRLEEKLAGKYQLSFTTNSSVRREVLRIFDSTFAITYALEAIAIAVAALGVISTLITLILERKREVAMLRFLGATAAQIRRVIVIEALLVGAVGQFVGVLIGVMLSLVLIYVINVQSFGWTIQFHFPLWFLAQSTLVIVAVAAAAGLYPASRAAKVEAVAVVREE